jgi:DNA-binding NarL/FixJ family response regulator
VHLWGAADRLHEEQALAILPPEQARTEQRRAVARVQLGSDVFAIAWAEGRQMTPEQAFATRTQATPTTSQGYPGELTPREVEVLRLLALGLTNAQIAERLVISPRTVNAHLRSIYSKLDLTSRTTATRYAIDHDLV